MDFDTFSAFAFVVGASGGFLHEATRWISLRHEEALPAYMSKIHYWLFTVALVIASGLLAGFLEPKSAKEALLIGIAGPAILSRLSTVIPPNLNLGSDEDAEVEEGNLRKWLKG